MISYGQINASFLSCWSLSVDLRVNRPFAAEGRTLKGELHISPLLDSASQNYKSICWEEPFEQTLYGNLKLDSKGLFVVGDLDPTPEIKNHLLSSCKPDQDQPVTLRQVIEDLHSYLQRGEGQETAIYDMLYGNYALVLLEEPFEEVLRWMKDCYRRVTNSGSGVCQGYDESNWDVDSGGSLLQIQAEITAILRLQLSIVDGFLELAIRPFLKDLASHNKRLADPLLHFSECLRSVAHSESTEHFSNLFLQLPSVNWVQSVAWMIASNESFFRRHFERILTSDDPSVLKTLARGRHMQEEIDWPWDDMFHERFEKEIQTVELVFMCVVTRQIRPNGHFKHIKLRPYSC